MSALDRVCNTQRIALTFTRDTAMVFILILTVNLNKTAFNNLPRIKST